ncbi:hypothetical protein N9N67_05480 [Bacteriovoracaceae bacterium]|nr:hypothetical protein [Bacteriovoracaceae bacterium]
MITLKKLILLLFISTSLCADEFFLNLINRGKQISWSEVQGQIYDTAQAGSFLSVGETHLHKESSSEINQIFLKEYTSHLNLFRVCSEKIDGFWAMEGPKEILKNSKLTKMNFYKLSLHTSKMDGCHLRLKAREGMIVYSGLYHQYPFGRNYAELPSHTPVQSYVKRNIAYDLKRLNGLFISHFEIDYLLNLHFKGLVLNSSSFEDFSKDLSGFSKQFESFMQKFEQLTERKEVIFFENDYFLKGKERNQRHKKIFAISNLSLKSRGQTNHLFYQVDKMDNNRKFLFYQLLRQSKFLVKSFYMEPDELGDFRVFTFANGHKFYGDFDYFQFLGPSRRGFTLFLENKPMPSFRLLIPGKPGYIEIENAMDYLLYQSKIFKIPTLDVSTSF